MLIAPIEVVWNSPAGRDYPLDNICLVLDQVEQEFLNECLGCDMYDWLIANVDAWPEDTAGWVDGNSYSVGDLVTREGKLYESLTNANTTDPLEDDGTDWEIPARFGTNACANELWEEYLVKILANKILQFTLNFTTHKTNANGLTVLDSGGSFDRQSFRSGSKAELKDYSNNLDTLNATIIRNMKRWASKKVSSGAVCEVPLSTIPGCGNGELCAPSMQKRRWGFKN